MSEIMLQQTGVERVRGAYQRFIRVFPSFRRLAAAGTADVLASWKGLGYNRRALALRECARCVTTRFHGRMPRTLDALMSLPGVGHATAAAIMVYAFNAPCAFIETNIRRVYLHFFFPQSGNVPDTRILPLVEETMDKDNPREWFYALMDYGAMLARSVPNPNVRSARYRKQSPFTGSLRELRGRVLQVMLDARTASAAEIQRGLGEADERLPEALRQLVAEGFLARTAGRYSFR